MFEKNAQDWDQFLQDFPDSHLLQRSQWAKLKDQYGWSAKWVIQNNADLKIGAQILIKRFLPGVKMAYIAKGPIFDPHKVPSSLIWSDFWKQVDSVCKNSGVFMLKVEPDIWINTEPFGDNKINQGQTKTIIPVYDWAADLPEGFYLSEHSIQPVRTLIVDIRGSEEQILARMKQKTRYNIKLAQRKGVVVRASQDIENFSKLMDITGNRDGFGVHDAKYYQSAYDIFAPRNESQLLTAEYNGEILAGIMVFANQNRAWYLYGASSNEKRELMPTYLLQWEAIRWARNRGCSVYDLWGVPDASLAQLEEQFTNRNEGLWGVYRFKRGFGGDLFKAAGPWDRIYNPLLYKIYKHRIQS